MLRLILMFVMIFSFGSFASEVQGATPAPLAESKVENGNLTFKVQGDTAIRFSSQGQACDATAEGAMRFNSTTKVFEGCNGTNQWMPLSPPKRIICRHLINLSGSDAHTYPSSYATGTMDKGLLIRHKFTSAECGGGVLPDSTYVGYPIAMMGSCSVLGKFVVFQREDSATDFPGYFAEITNCAGGAEFRVVYVQFDYGSSPAGAASLSAGIDKLVADHITAGLLAYIDK